MKKKASPKPQPIFLGGYVTVMRSFDYCHFEVSLPLEVSRWLSQSGHPRQEYLFTVNETRKECQRLVDKAVEQYKLAKLIADMKVKEDWQLKNLEDDAKKVREVADSERTPSQMATLKAWENYVYWKGRSFRYDYGDEDYYDPDED